METWFFEDQTGNFGIKVRVRSILFHEFSDFQEVAVFDTYEFGKMLVLDKAVMFTDVNEFVYHEMLPLVPLFSHARPERILIIGGGDGGAIRECLKNPFVKHIDLVDIDKMVIDVSVEFFPAISSGMKDERVSVIAADGIEFVKNAASGRLPDSQKYDIILIDSTDPVGPAEGLFRRDFYEACASALNDGGTFAAQTESPFFNKKLIKDVGTVIKEIFPSSALYLASIPVYPSGLWSFTAGAKKYAPQSINESYKNFDFSSLERELKYYSREVHASSFILPNFIKEIVK